jgi:hypothetical protein
MIQSSRTIALWFGLLALIYLAWSTANPHTTLQVWGGVAAIVASGVSVSFFLDWLTSRPVSPEIMQALRLAGEDRCPRCGTPRGLALWCGHCHRGIDNGIAIAVLAALLGAAGALWWSLK